MKKGNSEPLTETQIKELGLLAELPDDRIDVHDVPERTDWRGARRGAFFRPIKQQLTLRLDADVVDWFRAHATKGEGYQTLINSVLRSHVARYDRKAEEAAAVPASRR